MAGAVIVDVSWIGLNRCGNLEYRYAQAKIKNYISKGGYGGYGTKKGNFNRKKYQKN